MSFTRSSGRSTRDTNIPPAIYVFIMWLVLMSIRAHSVRRVVVILKGNVAANFALYFPFAVRKGGYMVHLEVRVGMGVGVGVEGRNKGYCFTFHMPSDVALLCYK